MERRLAAILAADVVGFSRLMGEDEAGTLAALKSHRKDLIAPKIAQYGGRTIKLMGDGELMEFPSVVEAVKFAIEVQCVMRQRNGDVAEDKQIVFRIGINIGDIIIEGDDIYGDGVNIAARLEGLALPGGICVRRNVRNEVRDKLDVDFEELGEIEVKNIARPVRAFSVVLNDKAAALVTPVVAIAKPSRPGLKLTIAAALTACIVLAAGLAWWQPWKSDFGPNDNVQESRNLPDKPSLVVLPFENLSADPDQEYFSDGLAADLITDLSKISGMYVVSRRASFRYRASEASPEQIAKELNARFILEGSVRRVGDQVRLNATLIDTVTGYHLWAERVDWQAEEIFSSQDQLTEQIARALDVTIETDERARVARRLTTNLEAYDYYLRGQYHFELYSKQSHAQARDMLEKAIDLDTEFAAAYALLSFVYSFDWDAQFGQVTNALDRAIAEAEKGIAVDAESADAYLSLAWAHAWKRQPEKAIRAGRKAVELDPNYSTAQGLLAEMLNVAGRPEEGLKQIESAIHLNPFHALWFEYVLGHSYDLLGRTQEAIDEMKKALAVNPEFVPALRHLAVIYSELERMDEAREAIAAVLKSSPNYTINAWHTRTRYVDPAIRQRFVDGLRKAGLPE